MFKDVNCCQTDIPNSVVKPTAVKTCCTNHCQLRKKGWFSNKNCRLEKFTNVRIEKQRRIYELPSKLKERG